MYKGQNSSPWCTMAYRWLNIVGPLRNQDPSVSEDVLNKIMMFELVSFSQHPEVNVTDLTTSPLRNRNPSVSEEVLNNITMFELESFRQYPEMILKI